MALKMRERGADILSRWHKLGIELGLGIGIASDSITMTADATNATRRESIEAAIPASTASPNAVSMPNRAGTRSPSNPGTKL